MEGDIGNIEMLQKLKQKVLSSLKKWGIALFEWAIVNPLKKLRKWINKSRFFLAILMLVIGISWTVVYYEGQELYKAAQTLFAPRTLTFVNNVLAAEPAKASEIVPEKRVENVDLEGLVRKTFSNDPEIALAVAMGESRLYNYKHLNDAPAKCKNGYPNCERGEYKGECSVGIFQVNLAENGCKGKWIHAGKVPGETIEEKIEWLRIPENNLKIAKQIYESRGNWSAWGAYTNGSYKKFLK